jgi:hypothetical protein
MEVHIRNAFSTLGVRVGISRENVALKLRRRGQVRGGLMEGEECYRKEGCCVQRAWG